MSTAPLFPESEAIVPARRLTARAEKIYTASSHSFETTETDSLVLDFDGIAGDFHQGMTRRSGGREPWYPRGTEMKNERQLSIVAADELAAIAQLMNLPEIRPEWMGANLLLSGIARLSMLPSGTKLFFDNGVTLKIDGQNTPCKLTGRAVARHGGKADDVGGALEFVAAAKRLRGLVAWVEKPGTIAAGEAASVRIPEQWIYRD